MNKLDYYQTTATEARFDTICAKTLREAARYFSNNNDTRQAGGLLSVIAKESDGFKSLGKKSKGALHSLFARPKRAVVLTNGALEYLDTIAVLELIAVLKSNRLVGPAGTRMNELAHLMSRSVQEKIKLN